MCVAGETNVISLRVSLPVSIAAVTGAAASTTPGGKAAHLRLRRHQVRLVRREGGSRRLHLCFGYRLIFVVKFGGALELHAREGKFSLRGLHLRLGTGVAVAELGQPRNVENRPVGADLFLVRGGRQNVRRYAAVPLGLFVDRNDSRAVVGCGDPQRRLDHAIPVALIRRLVATDKKAPNQERSKRDHSAQTEQLSSCPA